jgi:hypothetical protein
VCKRTLRVGARSRCRAVSKESQKKTRPSKGPRYSLTVVVQGSAFGAACKHSLSENSRTRKLESHRPPNKEW